MKVFLRLGGCLEPGGSSNGVLLTRTRWYCLPVKPPVTLWEETEDGVIFTVSSRSPGGARGSVGSGGEEVAVSGHPAAGVVVSGSPPGQSRALKAGTLPRLVRHLLDAPALGDTCYVPAFLATYRTFATTQEVLALLLERLKEVGAHGSGITPETAELPRALGSLLCSWLDGYPVDFVGLESSLREQLLSSLRWALGDGSEAEKSLAAASRERAPAGAKEEPEEDEGIMDDGDPDPHYILGLQAEDVAAHLTLQDAELFLRLVPHECLGSLWSQRDKKGHEGACPTVRATVAQFNRVANAVVASCLGDTALRATQRARLLEKWIRVAEECFSLRNFSSLYAVISALQSSPLHRLKRTWEETSRDSLRSYEELSTICSEEDNYSQSRRLLFQEGSPRGAGADSTQRRSPRSRRRSEQRPVGVVPYLGTFLKDLVMLDAATRNRLKNGYINFEKHRKEFEILTQLRLLQANCRNYTLQSDRALQRWLQRLPRLSETQSYQQSCAIEPPGEGVVSAKPMKPTLIITHCEDHFFPFFCSLLSSVGMNTQISWDRPSSPQAPPDLLLPSSSSSLHSAQHTKWPSVSALDTAPENTTPASPEGLAPPPAAGGTFIKGHRRSASCGSAYPRAPAPGSALPSECRIIRVRMELQNGTLYKSILVTSQDKAPAVIVKVLEKHNQDRTLAPKYELVQLLPEGRELAFPATANVFYAMNSLSQDFMLRPKRPQEKAPAPPPRTPSPRGMEISATFPKIKATGRKIAKALF
ncbi:ral guanine nucleotide dissociation stimulator-like 2 isoform X2 [Hemicordylus capensis]|uniref:ral guanine nucleotide dissociation stimulator-like 2 isoform X2 n=1 Tax=Hemicordylus capensis TaxID=884348 RepID=UPI0023024F27|nr:ral guanine nucleotide dissociation stimulator-like 2 isoform X2 [Hemicordylus capensis]